MTLLLTLILPLPIILVNHATKRRLRRTALREYFDSRQNWMWKNALYAKTCNKQFFWKNCKNRMGMVNSTNANRN